MVLRVLRQIGEAVAMAWLAGTLAFGLLQLTPGDAVDALGRDPRLTPVARATLRAEFGVDVPVQERYRRYLSRLARGELGFSTTRQRPVRAVLADAMPYSLLLMTSAFLLAIVGAIVLGTIHALRTGRGGDGSLSALSSSLSSVPEAWIALVVLGVLGVELGGFPLHGSCSQSLCDNPWSVRRIVDLAHHLALPALTLGALTMAPLMRLQRVAVRHTSLEPHVRAARARGLRARQVLWRHLMRPSLRPMAASVGLLLPALVGGAVFVERVFGWPGMGSVLLDAVMARDHALVMGIVMGASLLIQFGRGAAAALERRLDPRTSAAA